jgi:hypothetical protein
LAFGESERLYRKGRKERKGRAIGNWQLAFIFWSYALGVNERINCKGCEERKGRGQQRKGRLTFVSCSPVIGYTERFKPRSTMGRSNQPTKN